MRDTRKTPVVNSTRRAPAVSVAFAVSTGIISDWYGNWPFSLTILVAASLAMVWLALFLFQRNAKTRLQWGAVLLLGACASLGAAWHQFQWSMIRSNDLMAFAIDEPQPVRLLAIVESDPVLIRPEPEDFPTAISKQAKTLVNLRAVALVDQRGEVPVSGRVRLDVVGELESLSRGARIDVLGALSRPSVSRNPGGFDFRSFLRERGIHTIVRCDFPACVRVTEASGGGFWSPFQSWQKTCADRLRKTLKATNSPIAIALLLGPRTDISQELKQAFLQSGTVHFLAISGMNVAILATFLWFWGRLLRLRSRAQLVLIGLCLAGYVMITEADPPVVRAAVIIAVLLVSLFTGRRASPLNQLALAALIILVADPHDLFQVGAQLSFLAILALHWLWSQPWFNSPTPADPLDELEKKWWHRARDFLFQSLWQAFVTTTVVWVFTLPLILARFHLISPVGFLINIVLPFWMTLTLWCGYACLVAVLICPPLAYIPGACFDVGLTVFSWAVRYAASIPGGHFLLPGPPEWWLAVYCALIVILGSGVLPRQFRRSGWRGVLAWCIFGLVWGLPPRTNPGLRCTFLAVGHGAAILIELPNRQTLLYDAGSLEDSTRARLVVDSVLIQRGLTRLDAVLISHADIDHFNAVPGLLEDLDIGEIFISPAFLDFRQESVKRVCEAAIQAAVPLKLVWAGDTLQAGDGVTLKILHPEVKHPSGDDNANSIVLSIEYAGRKILLTGDLEKSGMLALLRQTPQTHEIILAPHHGSQKANPPELARWASPRWVVVSGGHNAAWNKLQENYGAGATLLSTSKHGAVTIDISSSGEIEVQTHLPPVPIVDNQGMP
ncbi:MAG: ComEC family competence protein [Planctomycetaceae bacterium]|nr:ComEC family competence protein [Planctomycetaceae bacterium]